jgi:tRNA threonylcarbamoyladenosine biosynthesis protein TsaB
VILTLLTSNTIDLCEGDVTVAAERDKAMNIQQTQHKKTILAFDTALGGISVGIIAANGHVVSRMVETQREQASLLIPLIQEVLEEAQSDFKAIDLIVCTKGPGSFTGLRIGLSTARTLGLALCVPVVGVNTLDLMARHYIITEMMSGNEAQGNNDTPSPDWLMLLETKRTDYYGRFYGADAVPLSEPFASDRADIMQKALSVSSNKSFKMGGDAVKRFQADVTEDFETKFEGMEEYKLSDPILLAQIGFEQFLRCGEEAAPQPIYLRGADVSQPKTPPRRLEQT